MELALFFKLGTAFVLGGLIGLEREHYKQTRKQISFAGIRTFALIGLFGALTQVLGTTYESLLWVFSIGFFILVILAYLNTSLRNREVGATTEIASLIVFINGFLCGLEKYILATALTLLVLITLHLKNPLHRWAKRIKEKELISTIEFMVVAFIILPLLPNQGYGPWEIFNPYLIWLMVVFILGISFLSYIAIKAIGPKRGLGVSGFLGGLLSSTALTMSLSEQSKLNRKIINPYVLAVVIASSAMFFRILFEVLVLNRDLISHLIIPLATMGLVGILGTIFFWRKKEKHPEIQKEAFNLASPFKLKPALKFGAFFALILFASRASSEYFGSEGVYLTSFLAGLVDVDAITISMANLARNSLNHSVAVTGITLAAMTNTLAKGGIFLIFGNRKVGKNIALVFVLMTLAGAISLLFI